MDVLVMLEGSPRSLIGARDVNSGPARCIRPPGAGRGDPVWVGTPESLALAWPRRSKADGYKRSMRRDPAFRALAGAWGDR